jgi:hypothetical protein
MHHVDSLFLPRVLCSFNKAKLEENCNRVARAVSVLVNVARSLPFGFRSFSQYETIEHRKFMCSFGSESKEKTGETPGWEIQKTRSVFKLVLGEHLPLRSLKLKIWKSFIIKYQNIHESRNRCHSKVELEKQRKRELNEFIQIILKTASNFKKDKNFNTFSQSTTREAFLKRIGKTNI